MLMEILKIQLNNRHKKKSRRGKMISSIINAGKILIDSVVTRGKTVSTKQKITDKQLKSLNKKNLKLKESPKE